MLTVCTKCKAPLTEKQIIATEILWRGGVHNLNGYCIPCYEQIKPSLIKRKAQKTKRQNQEDR